MVSMGVFRISFALLVITAACFAEEGDIENSGYGEMSEDQYRNIEKTLATDGPEDDCLSGDKGCMKEEDPLDVQKRIGIDSGNKEDEEEEKQESVGLLGILIAIILSVFIMLGVFNHVIIPFCCIGKKDKKDKEQGGAVLKMSELENDEKNNTDLHTDLEESKVGGHNEAVDNVSLTGVEKDTERIESIENENFDRAILNAVSAIEVTPEPKKKPAIVNEEYTNTPRNIDVSIVLNNENLSKGPMPNIKEEAGESDKYQTSDSQTNEEEEKGEQKNDATAFDDESLTTIEKDIERVDSVANDSFDRAILNAVSAIEVSPEHKKKLSDDNRETVAVSNEELNKGPQKEKPSASSWSKDAKEMFRSRKKSTMSIQIEDGNIKNYVEGPPGESIPQ
eukprot:GFUD01077499.1.p1 GENE.GFUD01077499.1~~GFUD01077499.1.p1  ORF type:complete len:402 (+),score=122.16 GFUD01077499.1:29-1207(+)